MLQRHDEEQLDAERLLRASLARLESRTRVLEGQGVRADRRAAELAGLAQALTEEQRALLIRLDRLEEHLRGSRQRDREPQQLSEEHLRRLNRLEREHRAFAKTMHLIVRHSDEAEQQNGQRWRSLEELMDGRLRPIEERLCMPVPEALRSQFYEELRVPALVPVPGSIGDAVRRCAAAATYAAQATSTPRQRQRNHPDGGSCSGGSGATSRGEAWAGLVCEPLASGGLPSSAEGSPEGPNWPKCSLDARTDAAEERICVLSRAMEELSARVATVMAQVSTAQGGEPRVLQVEPPQLGRRELENAGASVAELARRSEVHEASFVDLRARLEHLATHEQVAAACRDSQGVQALRVEELRAGLEKLASSHDGRSSGLAESVRLHAAALEQLRSDVDALSAEGQRRQHGRAPELEVPGEDMANLGKKVEEQASALGELRSRVRALSRETAEGHAAPLAELNEQLRALSRRTNTSESHAAAIEELREQHRALSRKLVATDGHAAALSELQEQMQAMVRSAVYTDKRVAAIGRLREQMTAHGLSQKRSECQKALDDSQQSIQEMPVPAEPSVEFNAELQELRSRCDGLQEAIDHHVMVSIWRVEKQLPEAIEKVDRLVGDYPQHIAKVEENDVRLGLALARLGTQEQRVQGCLERIERLPSQETIRKVCREELWKRLKEADVEGLCWSVDLQGRAIEELGERLQEVCDVVCYGGEPPEEELAVRKELSTAHHGLRLRPLAIAGDDRRGPSARDGS